MTKEQLEELKKKIHKSETILNGKRSANDDKSNLIQFLFKLENDISGLDDKFELAYQEHRMFGHDFPRTVIDKDIVITIIKRRIQQLDECIQKLDEEFKNL